MTTATDSKIAAAKIPLAQALNIYRQLPSAAA